MNTNKLRRLDQRDTSLDHQNQDKTRMSTYINQNNKCKGKATQVTKCKTTPFTAESTTGASNTTESQAKNLKAQNKKLLYVHRKT